MTRRSTVALALLAAALAGSAGAAPAAGAAPELKPQAAARSPIATQAALLASAWAGSRAVAVGDHGVVLLSDDRGAHWRQARSVPVSFQLNAVSFADSMHGWAVGHGGSILASSDGGETWQLQRLTLQEDRPLFAVHFRDARHGVAVGLWSLVLTTDDGGVHWQEQHIDPTPGTKKADLNLLGLFADAHGALYASAERGQVLRSDDGGRSWHYLPTGYKGSLWCGAALPDGALLVGGQRGTLLRSDDQGRSWTTLPLATKSSITSITSAGGITLTGLDGLVARSTDGRAFVLAPQPDGVTLTSALALPGAQALLFSRHGVVGGNTRP